MRFFSLQCERTGVGARLQGAAHDVQAVGHLVIEDIEGSLLLAAKADVDVVYTVV